MSTSRRVDDLFLVLKVISRAVDNAHGLTTTLLATAHADRRTADNCRDDCNVAALHTLCRRAIDERETVATSLEAIRLALAVADIVPRTRNLGRAARSVKPRRPRTAGKSRSRDLSRR